MVDRSTAAVRLMAGDKEPVRLASTANLSLSGLLTVDGVVTVAGDRVLVKDQTDTTANGIYTVSSGIWRRAPDSNSNRNLIAGMKVAVQEGTAHAGDVWNLDSNRPDLGTDDIEFSFYLNTDIADTIDEARQTLIDEAAAIIAMGLGAGKASQAEAEAGVTNTPWMTPLRTAQAIGKPMSAYTIKGNATGGSAGPTDIDVTALTLKSALAPTDILMLQDSAAANAFKRTTVASLGGAVPGAIFGLQIANNATDATNDIDISTGRATDDTNAVSMSLAAGLTKRLDGNWFAGTNQGALDTGSIADGTYHVFQIQRPDTGVVDILFSASPSAPTMPANYTYKRRIASFIRSAGAILAFRQQGDLFRLSAPVVSRNSTAIVTDTLLSLTVPTGIRVVTLITVDQQQNAAGSAVQLLDDGDVLNANVPVSRTAAASEYSVGLADFFVTNTAGQLRFSLANDSGSLTTARVFTNGWIDGRGR